HIERIDDRYGVRLAQLNLGHAYLQASWGDGRAASEASEACGGDAQAQLGERLAQAQRLLETVSALSKQPEAGDDESAFRVDVVMSSLADAYLALLHLRLEQFEAAMTCFASAIAQDELANAELGAAFERLGEELLLRAHWEEAMTAMEASRAQHEGLGQHATVRRLSRRMTELRNQMSSAARHRES
ncbi:MAG: hypothetical protein RBU37_00720, partial [Myxococcota bacterium]|nr:hypothetical protein [Myxococcota bacterium]